MKAALELVVPVAAPAEQTWAAVTDWPTQGEWMLGTRVEATAQDGQGVGGALSAFTGIGRLGFLDTMTITAWEPPHRCDVLHTGRVVRGTGSFVVRVTGTASSELVWREDLDLPLGRVGWLGWQLVRPVFAAGVRVSLRRFARFAASRPMS
jgi:hypothetical protein